ERRLLPLSQASEGTFDESGKQLFFVRPAFHGNVTKRYRGGTARKIWKFVSGEPEAEVLTQDFAGESHTPMWWRGRVYFISDRDGTMNLWSMNSSGGRLEQHTYHSGWDVRDADLNSGRIVYQLGADLWLYDIKSGRSQAIDVRLASDFDQLRERWVKNPARYLTAVHLHPKGESIVLTTRGRLFVVPVKQGRTVRASMKPGVRFRDAVFMPDGKHLLALSDETGEFEFVSIPATGVGERDPLTKNGSVLRFQGHPAPDGKSIAYIDNNRDLWLLEMGNGRQNLISTNRQGVADISWSPDSRWIVFRQHASNTFAQLLLYGVEDESLTPLTSDRFNCVSPDWSPDGKWIYFLSDRNLRSSVGSPWGARQPEPFFEKPMKIYQIGLRKGLRSPFKATDELFEDLKTEYDAAYQEALR
ncbi:MAG: S41 family peptidase, partial [bacterium]